MSEEDHNMSGIASSRRGQNTLEEIPFKEPLITMIIRTMNVLY